MCGITHIWKPFLVILEIVNEIPFTHIDAFSIRFFLSLELISKTKKGFQIWVIPHTFKLTNLSKVKKGSLVNIEIDILSKYVKNFFNAKK